MVLAERDSYKKLEKRPANEGLFIVFGAGRGNITRFLLPPGFCRWPRVTVIARHENAEAIWEGHEIATPLFRGSQ
jgi:hypothetical protein